MAKKLTQEELLEKIHQKLSDINTNMLKVFWIVAIFAFLKPHCAIASHVDRRQQPSSTQ